MSDTGKTNTDLENHYRAYIGTINALPQSTLNPYLAPTIIHNDRNLTPEEYHKLVVNGAVFTVDSVIADVQKKKVAARLSIEWSNDKGGKTEVKEHVFYQLNEDWQIEQVWSMVEYL
ncbi:hypothetical protein CI109_101085 [Kwoniella shandongensis]|uniref:Uncharacterized protein n=1 Tax=Kwoniella shandongensis TaxID=1734106 RepID=A0A5M6C4V7_9TREE|nr:uncharacterized protein CI109_001554 [Kwoniella shandongensis]KAA5530148.1 hypothetical protein CI109_001554 [Kwoniella shandongensis]